MAGLYFEEFTVGRVFDHAWTRTVTEMDNVLYSSLTMNVQPLHLDEEFARGVGLPGRIVHGLCTMAFAGRAVLEAAGIGDPRAVERIAVRFSAPLFPGESVTTRVWNVDGAFGFEAVNAQGTAILKDGRLELR
jgi:acyl dehydratase